MLGFIQTVMRKYPEFSIIFWKNYSGFCLKKQTNKQTKNMILWKQERKQSVQIRFDFHVLGEELWSVGPGFSKRVWRKMVVYNIHQYDVVSRLSSNVSLGKIVINCLTGSNLQEKLSCFIKTRFSWEEWNLHKVIKNLDMVTIT